MKKLDLTWLHKYIYIYLNKLNYCVAFINLKTEHTGCSWWSPHFNAKLTKFKMITLFEKNTLNQFLCSGNEIFCDYSLTVVQKLQLNNRPKTLEFWRTFLERQWLDPDNVKSICFSDEAIFHVNGSLNRHNSLVYSY